MAAVVLVALAALAGMRLEFDGMQSPDWQFRDSKAVEGYQWLANNTENDSVVLAWWDYADGIEKMGHRGVVIREASQKSKILSVDIKILGSRGISWNMPCGIPMSPMRRSEMWLLSSYQRTQRLLRRSPEGLVQTTRS